MCFVLFKWKSLNWTGVFHLNTGAVTHYSEVWWEIHYFKWIQIYILQARASQIWSNVKKKHTKICFRGEKKLSPALFRTGTPPWNVHLRAENPISGFKNTFLLSLETIIYQCKEQMSPAADDTTHGRDSGLSQAAEATSLTSLREWWLHCCLSKIPETALPHYWFNLVCSKRMEAVIYKWARERGPEINRAFAGGEQEVVAKSESCAVYYKTRVWTESQGFLQQSGAVNVNLLKLWFKTYFFSFFSFGTSRALKHIHKEWT